MQMSVWVTVFCVVAFWTAAAPAQAPRAHTRTALPDAGAMDVAAIQAPPEFENRPRSAFENSLMGEIACTCGTCEREPINTCGCEFAAKMRAEVLAELDTHDMSSETGRHIAADSVRASLVAKYGPKVLRRAPNLDVPAGAAVAFIFVAIAVRTIRRRGRGRGDRRVPSTRTDADRLPDDHLDN